MKAHAGLGLLTSWFLTSAIKLLIFSFFYFSVMTENAFRARDIGLRAQKKILSRMATKTIAKTFIDGTTASLLDNIYRLAKLHVRIISIFIKRVKYTTYKVHTLYQRCFNSHRIFN